MPGLNQIKQFYENISSLGDELTIRRTRGDIIEQLEMPEGISEADDSEDFLYGLPVESTDEQASAAEEKAPETADSGNIDINALLNENLSGEQPAQSGPASTSPGQPSAQPDFDVDAFLKENLGDSAPAVQEPSAPPAPEVSVEPDIPAPSAESTASADDLPMPDFDFGGTSDAGDFSADFTEPAASAEPAGSSTDDFEMPDFGSFSDTGDTANSDDTSGSVSEDDIPLPDFSDTDNFDVPGASAGAEPAAAPEASASADEDLPMPDFDFGGEESSGTETSDSGDGMDLSGFDFSDSGDKASDDAGSSDAPVQDQSSLIPDFNLDDADNPAIEDDSGSDLDFSIPGFSDVTEATIPKKPLPKQEDEEDKILQANQFTDAEHKKFLENLYYYPLNLRMEIETLLVENQFKEEENINLIRMIIKKPPVRQLASHVGKMLDKHIEVPRNYEKRTAAQYEAYKATAEYQIKNRILPAAFATIVIGALLFSLCYLTNLFIIKPVRAEMLYKEGYSQLENNLFPQSEETFNKAITFKKNKKWAFKYANGYRDKKQFVHARRMYTWLLNVFPKDKNAGLQYAEMELYDLSNYEEAERVVRRYVLDRFINDYDGMLLLGDIYLEWGTDTDPSKFPLALEAYENLKEVYEQDNTYLARMLRYYIRTDNLQKVLPLKAYFYPDKKTGNKRIKKYLSPEDIYELSDYLLGKLYGVLSPAEEYLRTYIEDVLPLLRCTIEADPTMPEAYYNSARYYLHTGNIATAQSDLTRSLQLFKSVSKKTRRRILNNIDAYRLLGELYKNQRDFIKAEEQYSQGIMLFEKEKDISTLKAGQQVGQLYSDMGDIEYFISGDNDAALRNYQKSIQYDNDTSSIRYRIGYIYYAAKQYVESLGSLLTAAEESGNDLHLLLALGNVLSLRDDNFAAEGYFERFIDEFDRIRIREKIILPQVDPDHNDLVENYMRAANNYGVALSRLALRTGNSSQNAKAMVYFSESSRAWDALTRNQTTLERNPASNLASQNLKYLSYPQSTFDPAMYFDIPRTLQDEEILTQSSQR